MEEKFEFFENAFLDGKESSIKADKRFREENLKQF